MTAAAPAPPALSPAVEVSDLAAAALLPADEVLRGLGADAATGLDAGEASRRLQRWGPNDLVSHRARLVPVLAHQLRSPLLGLLVGAAVLSAVLGERTSAVVIGVIVGLSIVLGSVNEFRAERAAEALHDEVVHEVVVTRDGRAALLDVHDLVPGDVVELRLGAVVPADLRLLAVTGLECDESVLTGESAAVEKGTAAVALGTGLPDLTCCALMGTVVRAGSGRGVVVSTGSRTAFGRIAAGLGTHPLDTAFQVGLQRFSGLLVRVGAVLTISIFVINALLQRPLLDALLFSLAIAVGITPQLLPAVVSTSLAAGSRRMRARRVLVKRLVCIEDLGDVDVLLTDKTGTLTEGRIDLERVVVLAAPSGTGPSGARAAEAALLLDGLRCTEGALAGAGDVLGANPLDQALWRSPAARPLVERVRATETLGVLPFDHERRMVSVVVREPGGDVVLITKGAPEDVLARCTDVTDAARAALAGEFAAGHRVVAVARRTLVPGAAAAAGPTPGDERDLQLVGLLVLSDPPRADAAAALQRLAGLGIEVEVVTGDAAAVAVRVCTDLGLAVAGVLTGTDLDALDDDELAAAIPGTTVFARVSPEHKARVVRLRRRTGGGVAFLGDGVNDALALHAADVGISVDSATDVAKDAADVILLEKDLDVLADGVVEGRRIFANTMKYVLMGTSSNVGNMFSAAAASLFLGFLPMLPSQILLNNLLYDTSQLAIPTDRADEEQLRRPAHWDIGQIRRFMLVFGPLSSLFDVVLFVVMLAVFHAGADEFRTGWFVESLATQCLVVFAIRTRRVPFFRSRPSMPVALTAVGVAVAGAVLPSTPLAGMLGCTPLPAAFFAVLVGMVVAYLALIEVGKTFFYRAERRADRTPPLPSPEQHPAPDRSPAPDPSSPHHHLRSAHRHQRRRAACFSTSHPLREEKTR